MKNKLLTTIGVLALLMGMGINALALEGSRMMGRAGSGVGISGEPDAIYANPAGLAGVNQSFLQQTYNQTEFDKTISQSFVLTLNDNTAIGGLVNIQINNSTEKVSVIPSLSASTRLFDFLSLGVNADNISSKPIYSIGAVAGFRSPVSRIAALEAGIYHENVKADIFFDRNNLSRPQTAKAVAGGHLRLRTDDGAFIDLMFDTDYLNDFKEIPFSRSVKRAGIEQTYHFGESSSLSMRTGMELPTKGSAIYSVGLGWKFGFLSLDAAMRMEQIENDHFAISATFLLGERTQKNPIKKMEASAQTEKNVSQTKQPKVNHLFLGNGYNTLKCSIIPSEGLNDGNMGLILNTQGTEEIGAWAIHLIDMDSLSIVKTFLGDGKPPIAYQIDIGSLQEGNYRVDFSCVTKDLSKTGSSESAFVKNKNDVVASIK